MARATVIRSLAIYVWIGCCSVALLAASGRWSAADLAPHIAIDDPSWRLDSSADGISIYTSSVPGVGIVPCKAIMTIPGSIAEVSLVLEDISRRGEWISHFGESLLLERTNDYDQTEYLRVDVPWPATDRSAVVRARISVSDDLQQATIAAESVESHLADRLPKLVRSQVYASTFQMKQVGERVEVVALVFIDPRGSVPKWIVNHFTRHVSRSTLSGLRRQVARKLYTPAQVAAMNQRINSYQAFREQHANAR
jgi:START domain